MSTNELPIASQITTNVEPDSSASDPAELRPTLTAGAIVIGIFFFGFGGWATFAPLNSAAVAPGSVTVESNRKMLQHLEGGIVGEILIKDGDQVRIGETMIRLDETQPKANLELLNLRMMTAVALEARLIAERDKKSKVAFPDWLVNSSSVKAAKITSGQKTIFAARRNATNGQIAVLKQRNQQFRQEIKGLTGQIKAEIRQIELIDVEIKDVSGLYKKGFARKPHLLGLQREEARIEGSRSQNIANVARIEQSIIETDLRVIELEGNFINQVVEELSKVQAQTLDLDEQIVAAIDVLRRLDITAPINGVVMGLNVHTIGGVIGPGEPIMEIVPSDDRLIVEARVSPTDIDKVRVGLVAQVTFSAFSQRNSVPVDGKVIFVSADGLIDEATRESYFLAKVILLEGFKEALRGEEILPGMQAEVMIITGEQTPLDYLISPISGSLNRAWREN